MRKRIYLMRPNVGLEEINQIKKVIYSKHLTEGIMTQQFEREIANYTKSRYATATTSATTALHTMFHCMGVKGKKGIPQVLRWFEVINVLEKKGIPQALHFFGMTDSLGVKGKKKE